MTPTPDFSRDYVKMPRIAARELVADAVALQVYTACLERAAYHAGPRLVHGRVVSLDVGQLVFGREELALAIDSTPAKVRTAVQRLRSLGFLAIETTSQGTVATVLGYGETSTSGASESPAKSPADNQRIASASPADSQRIATNKDLRRKDLRRKEEEEASPPARGEHQRAIDAFDTYYRTTHGGAAPTWPGKGAKLMSTLVKQHGADEVIRRIGILASSPPTWPLPPWDVGTFAQHFDKVSTSRMGPRPVGRVEPQDASAYPEGRQQL